MKCSATAVSLAWSLCLLVAVCAIQDAGGIRATIDDAREQATVETEVGTHVDQCMSYDRQSFELAN